MSTHVVSRSTDSRGTSLPTRLCGSGYQLPVPLHTSWILLLPSGHWRLHPLYLANMHFHEHRFIRHALLNVEGVIRHLQRSRKPSLFLKPGKDGSPTTVAHPPLAVTLYGVMQSLSIESGAIPRCRKEGLCSSKCSLPSKQQLYNVILTKTSKESRARRIPSCAGALWQCMVRKLPVALSM
jgi:hypothetical protein